MRLPTLHQGFQAHQRLRLGTIKYQELLYSKCISKYISHIGTKIVNLIKILIFVSEL